MHYHTYTEQVLITDRDALQHSLRLSNNHGPRCTTTQPLLKYHEPTAKNYLTVPDQVPISDRDAQPHSLCSSTNQGPRSTTTQPLL
jgi:hypothetical protein